MRLKGRKLRQILEGHRSAYGHKRGTAVTVVTLRESLRKQVDATHKLCLEQNRDLRDENEFFGFSLLELAEALCGREWVLRLNDDNLERYGGVGLGEDLSVEALEATDAVDVTAFANITNVLLSSKIHEGYRNPAFVGDSLTATMPTRLDGEKIAGAGSIPDAAQTVPPGMPFPHVGFGEHYIETPATTKRGLICAVTKEAIFFDQTGQVARRAFQVGEILGRSREKRILDVVIGATNNYSENGTAYNTYIDAGTLWDNIQASNALADWTDVELAELLLAAMTDPANSEPIAAIPEAVIVNTALKHTARRIVSATEIRSGDITAGSGIQTVGSNPLQNYRVVSSPFIDARMSAASQATTTWYLGAPRRAFLYMQNWPLTVVQAPQNSEAEFEQDVVLRVKASERGVAGVSEPRAMTRSTA